MSNKIRILDRFEYDPKEDFLGEGSFAEVYRASKVNKRSDRISQTVALKFYNGGYSEKYDIISEVNRVLGISHPYLVKYLEADVLPLTNTLGRKINQQLGVMEYANGVEYLPNGKGDFRTFWKTLDLNKEADLVQLKSVLEMILKGLEYLHEQKIIHRDLKPTNILMHYNERNAKWIPKIGDFGVSKCLNQIELSETDSPSTIEYASPEQIYPKTFGIDKTIGYNSDLWSLGVIIYEIFNGKRLFGGRDNEHSSEDIRNNIYHFEQGKLSFDKIREPFKTLTKMCLVKEPSQRLNSAKNALIILENPIEFKKNNIQYNKKKSHQEEATILAEKTTFVDLKSKNPAQKNPKIDYEKTTFVDLKSPNSSFKSAAYKPSEKNESQRSVSQNEEMFKAPFSFEGRIRRKEYGLSWIIYTFLWIILELFLSEIPMIAFFLLIPILWFIFAQGAKREHDLGYKGWWQLIPFRFIFLIFADGEVGDNKYLLPYTFNLEKLWKVL